jgi:hypothetical protein
MKTRFSLSFEVVMSARAGWVWIQFLTIFCSYFLLGSFAPLGRSSQNRYFHSAVVLSDLNTKSDILSPPKMLCSRRFLSNNLQRRSQSTIGFIGLGHMVILKFSLRIFTHSSCFLLGFENGSLQILFSLWNYSIC